MTPNTLVRIHGTSPYAGMTGILGGYGHSYADVILTATGQHVDVPNGDLRVVDATPMTVAQWRASHNPPPVVIEPEPVIVAAPVPVVRVKPVSKPARRRERIVSPAPRETVYPEPGYANARTITRLREKLAAGRVSR